MVLDIYLINGHNAHALPRPRAIPEVPFGIPLTGLLVVAADPGLAIPLVVEVDPMRE